jgi:hypothetical protein
MPRASAVSTEFAPEDKSKSYQTGKPYPIRVYLAGPAPYVPQDIITISSDRMLRFANGVLEIKNEADERVVRKSMGNRIYDEDISPDDPPLECPQTNWFCRSSKALTAHLKRIPVTALG